MRFFSASIPFPFHCRIGLICSSSTLRNSGFCMLQKGQGIPAAAALNKKVLLSKEISYLFALALHQKKLMHETWSGNQGKWRFHRERERERERCFTSKALVTARIDVSDSGPSACKLIREGKFHWNICKRKMKNSCPLHCHMVN